MKDDHDYGNQRSCQHEEVDIYVVISWRETKNEKQTCVVLLVGVVLSGPAAVAVAADVVLSVVAAAAVLLI